VILDLNKTYQGDCLGLMQGMPDNSIDLIFTDPPYALGSEIIIRPDGKPDYKKAVDFKNKWEMPTGEFWEAWYKEAFRILKYGGHCLMFGMDRQNFMFKYYGHLAGFVGKQSLYWYFISNFPKACDLSRMIEKNLGVEAIGSEKPTFGLSNKEKGWNTVNNKLMPETQTELGKKYSGYKYSVAPLKQVVEEIMVFQKPMKTGSVLHDVLAMENGDESITCGALDIDGDRVEIFDKEEYEKKQMSFRNSDTSKRIWENGKKQGVNPVESIVSGRYPAQAFLTNTEGILDEQSEESKSNWRKNKGDHKGCFGNNKPVTTKFIPDDTGGISRILHKCPYESEDFDLFNYNPKVSGQEREDSNHPTMKPVKLIIHILNLFKTPNKQVVLDTFAGSGTIGVGCLYTKQDFILIEKNPEYIKIIENRIGKIQNQASVFDVLGEQE
jgi:DNA modification methylase